MPSLKSLILLVIPAAVAEMQIGTTTEFRECSVNPRPIFAQTCIGFNSTGSTNFTRGVGCRQYGNTLCNGNYTTSGYRSGCFENIRFLQSFGTTSGGLYCFAS
ncbi:hypothetical protein BO70DRAFT_393909 [Aspergillus heteromorphus CBS 117.55]|uniref:Cyanovirin-N domain-containing protein n=1 Tax=Aspergillus heteromorphus CBS 117.55 TaxID=1448321 RepID=A0A317WNX4_9EURO|nr:uncharacterized protein BO70DRAFT_393909 [Aspergillus heteromorphus CBS 117.55]PWY88184.1 hypothetical protein BO70DRAFT_393909 [Aspergillus heteromorphus CBS 117.55]